MPRVGFSFLYYRFWFNNTGEPYCKVQLELFPSSGIIGSCVKSMETVCVEEVQKDERYDARENLVENKYINTTK